MRILLSLVVLACLMTVFSSCETGGSALDRPAADTQPLGPMDSINNPNNPQFQPRANPGHPFP